MNTANWKIILATSNNNKVDELQNIFLQTNIKNIALIGKNKINVLKNHTVEESGVTFYENALLKCKQTYSACIKNASEQFLGTIADDSGLVVPALNGEPGLHSARYSKEATDEANRKKLIKKIIGLKKKSTTNNTTLSTAAYFVCCIIFYSEREKNSKNTIITAEGKLHGRTITTEKGKLGFGYDKIFIPSGYNKTLAQLTKQQKNSISHRAIASKLLAKKMATFFSNLSIL